MGEPAKGASFVSDPRQDSIVKRICWDQIFAGGGTSSKTGLGFFDITIFVLETSRANWVIEALIE